MCVRPVTAAYVNLLQQSAVQSVLNISFRKKDLAFSHTNAVVQAAQEKDICFIISIKRNYYSSGEDKTERALSGNSQQVVAVKIKNSIMKKSIFFITLAVVSALTVSGQGLFTKIKNKVKNTVENRAVSNIDKKVNSTIDEIEGKNTFPGGNNQNAAAGIAENNGLASYSKYDFIPGDTVLYTEDFSSQAAGELPPGWNTNGKGEVVTLNTIGGYWLKLGERCVFLTANKKEFTKNFTIECDLVFQLSNTGQYWPRVSLGFLSSGETAPNDNELVLHYNKYQSCRLTYSPNLDGGGWDFNSDLKGTGYMKASMVRTPFMKSYLNTVVHLAMQVQEKRLRIWINGEKLYDIPTAVAEEFPSNQLFIEMNALPDPRFAYYISNIKVAAGSPDTRHKLIDEGRFSTTGILFDVNAATIKPESNGVLKSLADVLKNNPGYNIKIIGHTDSDGSDASNITLSQKRAAAVKVALSKIYGIEETRMVTDGKGESEPVGDNTTKEGKLQNRRVEFIKN